MSRALLVLLFVIAAAAHAAAADFHQVGYGATVDITEHAACRRVTNNHASGLPLFVPTKTATEWSAFYGSTVPGVSVGPCTLPRQYIILASGTSWTVPSDWNSADNTVHAVGGGGGGIGTSSGLWGGGGGGGGGAYSATSNLALTPGASVS